MKNTDTPETEAETQQALATALKHLRETKRELGALRENQKSYLERLYSGELPNHKWDGEKWIAESQENIHAYLSSAVVPGPPMCALAPWELSLGDARKKVAEYLTEIRKLEDELSLRSEQSDAAKSDWNEACDDRNAYYHELTKANLDVERMNWIEKHSTRILCFENIAGNVETYEVDACRAMIDREISQQNAEVKCGNADPPI